MNANKDFKEDVVVPSGLRQELSDMIDSMDAAERILSSGMSPARRLMTCIMSAAAGVILLVGVWMAAETFRTPEDTFTDPQAAYAEVEKALVSISEKVNSGLEKASEAEKKLDGNIDRVMKLYY